MNDKGQGAIEYLLIIGAAILVVAVVIIALVSITQTASDDTTGEEAQEAQIMQKCQVQCGTSGGTWADNMCSIEFDETGDIDCAKYMPAP